VWDDDRPAPEENPMSLIPRFAAYAAAFEKAFETNDFSHIEPFFTEDAVYVTSGADAFAARSEGRDAVFAHLEGSLDSLDRRFATRAVDILEGPTETDSTVWFAWRATYTIPGHPDVVIDGEETVKFEGDRICFMEDRFVPETAFAAAEALERMGSTG
jgi:hypothetical protein